MLQIGSSRSGPHEEQRDIATEESLNFGPSGELRQIKPSNQASTQQTDQLSRDSGHRRARIERGGAAGRPDKQKCGVVEIGFSEVELRDLSSQRQVMTVSFPRGRGR